MINYEERSIRKAEILVREAGYNYSELSKLARTDLEGGLSRAKNLYSLAKDLLRHLDPDNAEALIQSTYGYEVNNG